MATPTPNRHTRSIEELAQTNRSVSSRSLTFVKNVVYRSRVEAVSQGGANYEARV